MGRNTHRFDKWMVKFLTAHALELEDKTEGGLDPGLGSNQVSGYAQLERGRVTENLMLSIQDYNK